MGGACLVGPLAAPLRASRCRVVTRYRAVARKLPGAPGGSGMSGGSGGGLRGQRERPDCSGLSVLLGVVLGLRGGGHLGRGDLDAVPLRLCLHACQGITLLPLRCGEIVRHGASDQVQDRAVCL